MIKVRKSNERGHFNHDWLDTYHTFSFGDYYDPENMSFRTLRVINEDVVAPGEGFPTHSHHDMEIITYILEGELAHKDSMGNEETIKTGELQHMSAGRGVRHSEYNASDKTPCHLLQIWILPAEKGIDPGYEQKIFKDTGKTLQLVVSPNAEEGALRIHQNAKIYLGRLSKNNKADYPITLGRHAWIQAAKGAFTLNGIKLEQGDGAAVSDEQKLMLEASSNCEFLLFDLN